VLAALVDNQAALVNNQAVNWLCHFAFPCFASPSLFLRFAAFPLCFPFAFPSLSLYFCVSLSLLPYPLYIATPVPPCALEMLEYAAIIGQLEAKRSAYENNVYRRPEQRHKKRWVELLAYDHASPPKLSSGRMSVRHRAHDLAKNILQRCGSEVLLLVLSSLDQQKLSRLDTTAFVTALQTWWGDVPHPSTLTIVASEHFAKHDLGRVVMASQQRSFESLSTERDASGALGKVISLPLSPVLNSSRVCNLQRRAMHPKDGGSRSLVYHRHGSRSFTEMSQLRRR
jgi:hypothetical protein